MSITASAPTPAGADGATPSVEQLFAHAATQIAVAAGELWPGVPVRLAEHVPSVTGYVQRVEVGERMLYAKYSFLGSSLVSVLRGARGGWEEVRAAQLAYAAGPGSLLEREAAQLRILHQLGRPQVCRVAGCRRGVLFTAPVNGPTLAQLLLAEPHHAGELLEHTVKQLGDLHRPHMAQRFASSGAIEERSIAGTFLRKFNDISGEVYLNQLEAERHDSVQRQKVTAVLRPVVSRLRQLRVTDLPTARPVLVYGDFKPEHVVFTAATERPVFIDPGLLRARATVDAAKLVSRTVLLLIGSQPDAVTRQVITESLHALVDGQTSALPKAAQAAWLRELVLLWLMDTVNILTTYLSAPAGLPLPAHATAITTRAVTVCELVEKISIALLTRTSPYTFWRLGLAEASRAAQRVARS